MSQAEGKQKLNLFLIPGGDIMSLTIIVTQVQNPLVTVLKSKELWKQIFFRSFQHLFDSRPVETDLETFFPII